MISSTFSWADATSPIASRSPNTSARFLMGLPPGPFGYGPDHFPKLHGSLSTAGIAIVRRPAEGGSDGPPWWRKRPTHRALLHREIWIPRHGRPCWLRGQNSGSRRRGPAHSVPPSRLGMVSSSYTEPKLQRG